MFQHYIVTRFNLKMGWDADKRGVALLSKEWMDNRFKLFTDYCLPSIANQGNLKFQWLVYFDTDTDDFYKNKIEKIAADFSHFIPRYVDHHDSFLTDLETYVRAKQKDGHTHLITTRLDSDDLLHQDAVDKIQRLFKQQDCQIINFQTGIRFQLEPEIRLTEYEWKTGPFLNVIEKLDPEKKILTGYAQRHDFYVKDYDVLQITEKPYWTQLIHDANHTSTLSGKSLSDITLLRPFNIDTTALQVSYSSMLKGKCFDILKRVTPEIIKTKLR